MRTEALAYRHVWPVRLRFRTILSTSKPDIWGGAHLKFFRLSESVSLTPCFSWVLSEEGATVNRFNGFQRPREDRRRQRKKNVRCARRFLTLARTGGGSRLLATRRVFLGP